MLATRSGFDPVGVPARMAEAEFVERAAEVALTLEAMVSKVSAHILDQIGERLPAIVGDHDVDAMPAFAHIFRQVAKIGRIGPFVDRNQLGDNPVRGGEGDRETRRIQQGREIHDRFAPDVSGGERQLQFSDDAGGAIGVMNQVHIAAAQLDDLGGFGHRSLPRSRRYCRDRGGYPNCKCRCRHGRRR